MGNGLIAAGRHLAIATVAFVLTAAAVHRLAGMPEVGMLEDKIVHFERHADTFDVLFFGSSRIDRGIDPVRFDRAMADAGQPLHSFNFGIAGMGAHETNALIRRVLERRPARLRWVVVELDDWDPVIRPQNRLKRRAVLWHDGRETISALRSTLRLDASPASRADLLLTHLVHFVARATAAGRGLELLRAERAKRRPTFERRGFRPFTQRSYEHHPMRKAFLRDLDAYRRAVAALPAVGDDRAWLDSYNTTALAAQVAMIRSAGAEPVHVLPPTPSVSSAVQGLASAGRVPWLLAFNDPETYPELFAIDRRFDREHLTTDGAAAFTEHLAARFAIRTATTNSGRRGP